MILQLSGMKHGNSMHRHQIKGYCMILAFKGNCSHKSFVYSCCLGLRALNFSIVLVDGVFSYMNITTNIIFNLYLYSIVTKYTLI